MLEELKNKLDQSLEIFREDLNSVRTGRASAGLVENLSVDVYGSKMTIKQIASVMIPDARSIAIQPWDKSSLAGIEKAIQESDLGLNPMNDGTMVRINVPPLSEERRSELAKIASGKAENAKVSVRNLRRDVMDKIAGQVKEKLIGEDEQARLEKQVQEKIDAVVAQIDDLLKQKETEIKTV
ncbi:MAG: ribosome recycling factor [Patescibacteria group bacterium]|jgi:ribosome recycling factor